jgi:hypothetical protein
MQCMTDFADFNKMTSAVRANIAYFDRLRVGGVRVDDFNQWNCILTYKRDLIRMQIYLKTNYRVQ